MVLLDAAKDGDIEINNRKNADKVYQNYLIDPNDDGDNKVRLKPIKKDMEAYTALLERKTPIEPSRVTDNYRLMRKLVATAGLSFEDYYDTIKSKLNVVCITLEAGDDAQLIFESINSTGLALTEADKVRNYLLMDMDADTQERCYANYWSKIEECTEEDTTILLRHYLTIKTRRKINDSKIYEEFKAFREKTQSDKEMQMQDILRHALKFSEIRHQVNATSPFQRKLRELNELDSTTHMPFLIAFLLFADENRFSDKDKTEVLNIVESYWARRIICELPTNALSNTFRTLHHEALRITSKIVSDIDAATYIEALKTVLLSKRQTSAFPNDKEIDIKFGERQIYLIPKQPYKKFLFARMENGDTKESGLTDIIGSLGNGGLTIEHIMPQHLNKEWRQMLGDDYERIHDKYLHTFANLTLTTYNSEMGNKPFADKLNGFDKNGTHIIGFKDSTLYLSKSLAGCTKWTEEELQRRNNEMSERFKAIFPYITTTLTLTTRKCEEIVTLDDDMEDLTGRKLKGWSFEGEQHKQTKWAFMMCDLCKEVFNQNQYEMTRMCDSKRNNLSNVKTSSAYLEFAPGLFINTNSSTQAKIGNIKGIFSDCGIDFSELSFTLSADTDEAESSTD